MVRTGRTRVTECSATSGAPVDEIERLLTKVRADGYEMFRSSTTSPGSLPDLKLQLHDVDITAYRIAQGSPLVGRSLAQIGFRSRFGVSVVAMRRDSQTLSDPGADTLLRLDDVLFVLGSSDEMSEVISVFSSSQKGNASS